MKLAFTLVVLVASAAAYTVPARQPRALVRRAGALRAEAAESGAEAAETDSLPLLDEWLRDESTASIVLALADACAVVADKVRTASCDSLSCFNSLGNDGDQFAVDMIAEAALLEAVTEAGSVASVSSKTDQVLRTVSAVSTAPYSVSLVPIDASSILDSNFAVGSIFGVFESGELVDVTGQQLAAAMTCSYGPRTAITLAVASREDTHEFVLVDGAWRKSNTFGAMSDEGKLFAPGNLRATRSNEKYAALVRHWLEGGYQLRYTGGLCSDVVQLLVKGRGIFANAPAAGDAPALNLLFEALPLAFLIEKAGGASSDGASSLLDVKVVTVGARTQVALGSRAEVARFDETVGPAAIVASPRRFEHV